MDRVKRYLLANAVGVVLLGLGLLYPSGWAGGIGVGLIVGSNVLMK